MRRPAWPPRRAASARLLAGRNPRTNLSTSRWCCCSPLRSSAGELQHAPRMRGPDSKPIRDLAPLQVLADDSPEERRDSVRRRLLLGCVDTSHDRHIDRRHHVSVRAPSPASPPPMGCSPAGGLLVGAALMHMLPESAELNEMLAGEEVRRGEGRRVVDTRPRRERIKVLPASWGKSALWRAPPTCFDLSPGGLGGGR